MKFTCNQQELAKALNIVSKAVTNKTTIHILKGILLEVHPDNKLRLVASDLDITIEDIIDVRDCEPGAIVVVSKLFGDIIRKLPNDDIFIEEIDGQVSISCKNSQFNIIGMQADEFPSIKEETENLSWIEFDKTTIRRMIPKTSFAASADISKGIITGILTELNSDNLRMVAIDGYRMAIANEPMINVEEQQFVISAKIFEEINKILAETGDEGYLQLAINDSSAIFKIENIKVVLRLLEGTFINYKDIIPHNNKITVKVNKGDLSKSIERASLLSTEGKNNLVKFAIRDNVMTITSQSEEGKVQEDILIEKTGDDLDIGFNSKYVQDVLKVIDDEEILIKLNTGITPCLVEPVDSDEYSYLILPVRLSN